MPAVLGIDAAWTNHGTSAVALVHRKNGSWRCVQLSSSYEEFCRDAGMVGTAFQTYGEKAVECTISSAVKLLKGGRLNVIAVDMPLANEPITCRRQADNDVSSAFRAAKCGTHTPTPSRPGEVSCNLVSAANRLGYKLKTEDIRDEEALIEVYPHPALLALCSCSSRVPYKVSKTRTYWKSTDLLTRRQNVLQEMRKILDALRREIQGIPVELPSILAVKSNTELKKYEDMLDALVCAWVGIKYLEGDAEAYGDSFAAIWIPKTARQQIGPHKRSRSAASGKG